MTVLVLTSTLTALAADPVVARAISAHDLLCHRGQPISGELEQRLERHVESTQTIDASC